MEGQGSGLSGALPLQSRCGAGQAGRVGCIPEPSRPSCLCSLGLSWGDRLSPQSWGLQGRLGWKCMATVYNSIKGATTPCDH